MSKKCNSCGTEKVPATIPFMAHENEVVRLERIIKRQWIVLIVAITIIFAQFAGFVWYESQFETISYEQDGEGINNVNLGEQGDLNNGSKGALQEETKE